MTQDFFAALDMDLNTSLPLSQGNPEKAAQLHMANGGNSGQIVCPACNGRGVKTYGYVNIKHYPCRMCQQTGKTTGKRVQQVQAAKKGRETAAANLQAKQRAFVQAHQDVCDFLQDNSNWSEFYRSMLDSIAQYGALTERQLESVRNGMAKQAARKTEVAVSAPKVEIAAIEALFDVASGNGLKRPVFRALDGIEVSRAPATGRNAGALYVREHKEYVGKIVQGSFHATRAASEKVLPRLLLVAADPLGQATLFGKQTGSCGCCGRELTDPVSIERGIGPICESKWGL